MSDYDFGIYLLQLYADQAGQSRPAVLANIKAKLGENATPIITGWGKSARLISVGVLKSKLSDAADGSDSPDSPSLADINQALFSAGAVLPSIPSLIPSAVEETASQVGSIALSGLKYVVILAVVVGLVYVVYTYRSIKRATA